MYQALNVHYISRISSSERFLFFKNNSRERFLVFVTHMDGKKESVLIGSSTHQTRHTSGQGSVSCDVIFSLPFGLESSGTDGTLPGGAVQLLQVLVLLIILNVDVFVESFRLYFDFE